MSSPGSKRCMVAYATRDEQWLWKVELPDSATVADVLAEARRLSNRTDIPWDSAPVGIYGQPCNRADIPRDADRIEIYRPLASDPRQRRRERVQTERRRANRGR